MMNLQPPAVTPASPAVTAAPPPRHRAPEAPRETFSQALDDAVAAEAQPPERTRAPSPPARGTDSARERRPAQATSPAEARRPEPEAAAQRTEGAEVSAEASDTPPADDDVAAAPGHLHTMLAHLRLGAAGAAAGSRGARAAGEHGKAGAPAADGADGPGGQRLAAAVSRQALQAGAAEGAERATPTPGGPGAAAGSTAAAAFEDHLSRATAVAAEPAARPGEALPAAAGPLGAGTAAVAGGAATSGPAPAEATLPAHPASADFGSQLGAQITTFVREGVEHAQLHLNPADMGPVSVRIQLEGATAVVQLGADQAGTRQALEQALPMLAASLREAGLTLTGGGVFEQARQGFASDSGAGGRQRGEGREGQDGRGGSMGASPAELRTAPERRRGVVDLIA